MSIEKRNLEDLFDEEDNDKEQNISNLEKRIEEIKEIKESRKRQQSKKYPKKHNKLVDRKFLVEVYDDNSSNSRVFLVIASGFIAAVVDFIDYVNKMSESSSLSVFNPDYDTLAIKELTGDTDGNIIFLGEMKKVN